MWQTERFVMVHFKLSKSVCVQILLVTVCVCVYVHHLHINVCLRLYIRTITSVCVFVFMLTVCMCVRNCFPECTRARASSGPDFPCVSAACAYSEVMCVYYTQPSYPHPCASMLLTATPPQTQTSSDWTGSPLPHSTFPAPFLFISFSVSNPVFPSLPFFFCPLSFPQ